MQESTNPSSPRQNQRWRCALGVVAIVLVTFISYWPALRGDFLWDDDRHVSGNRTLRDFHGLERIWLDRGATPQYYPMTHTSFWIEYHLWGLDPSGYHITNIVLHAVNALLLWRLLAMLEVPGALLAAAIFAVHPINVESVAWISERKNVLAMAFGLASTLSYLRETSRSYFVSLALFVCALLSKSVVATMPAVLLVVLWWKRGRITRDDLGRLVPFFIIGIVMGLMTASMERGHVGARGADWDLSFVDRVLIAGNAVWFYVRKILWPSRLMFSYPRWDIDARVLCWWALPVAVAVVAGMGALSRKRLGRGVVAGFLIFVGTLFPALGFFDTYPMRYSFVADHFVYMSAAALVALLVAAMPQRSRVPLDTVVVLIFATLTWQRAHVFTNLEALWRDTIAKNPSSWMASNNLAVVLSSKPDATRADLQEALELLARVQQLRPTHEKLGVNRTVAEQKLRLMDHPDDIDAHIALGLAYRQLGRFSDARAELEQALKLDPQSEAVRRGLELLDRPSAWPDLPE